MQEVNADIHHLCSAAASVVVPQQSSAVGGVVGGGGPDDVVAVVETVLDSQAYRRVADTAAEALATALEAQALNPNHTNHQDRTRDGTEISWQASFFEDTAEPEDGHGTANGSNETATAANPAGSSADTGGGDGERLILDYGGNRYGGNESKDSEVWNIDCSSEDGTLSPLSNRAASCPTPRPLSSPTRVAVRTVGVKAPRA